MDTTETHITYYYEEIYNNKKKERIFDNTILILFNYDLIFALNLGKVCIRRERYNFFHPKFWKNKDVGFDYIV